MAQMGMYVVSKCNSVRCTSSHGTACVRQTVGEDSCARVAQRIVIAGLSKKCVDDFRTFAQVDGLRVLPWRPKRSCFGPFLAQKVRR